MPTVADTLRAMAQSGRIADPLWAGGQLRGNAEMKAACEVGAVAWEIVQLVLAVKGTPANYEWRRIRQTARDLVSREAP